MEALLTVSTQSKQRFSSKRLHSFAAITGTNKSLDASDQIFVLEINKARYRLSAFKRIVYERYYTLKSVPLQYFICICLHYNNGNTQKQTSQLKRGYSFYKRRIQSNKSSITFHCCRCYDRVSFRLSFH
jgi:hypothetical protein